jgi:hypothetical protein
MSSGPFDDPQLDAAWRAYAEEDRRLRPDPALEARTLARLRGEAAELPGFAEVRLTTGEKGRATTSYAPWLALAASVAAAAFLAWPRAESPVVGPLEAHPMAMSGFAATAAAERPQPAAPAPTRYFAAAALEPYVQHVELPEAVMQFDTVPVRAHEPLQMVRLRLPLEALQALGLALFEVDASGIVDVDVVIGEDGLPRDIRQVRIGQEHR